MYLYCHCELIVNYTWAMQTQILEMHSCGIYKLPRTDQMRETLHSASSLVSKSHPRRLVSMRKPNQKQKRYDQTQK